jgi:hypothetical protein
MRSLRACSHALRIANVSRETFVPSATKSLEGRR